MEGQQQQPASPAVSVSAQHSIAAARDRRDLVEPQYGSSHHHHHHHHHHQHRTMRTRTHTHALACISLLAFLAATLGFCVAAEENGELKEAASLELAAERGAGAGAGAPSPGASGVRPRRARASADAWLRLMADYARPRSGANALDVADNTADDDDWFPRPIPVNIQIGRGASAASMPLLILPVPVQVPAAPAPAPTAQCSADNGKPSPAQDYYSKESATPQPPSTGRGAPPPPLGVAAGRGAPPQWTTNNPQRRNFLTEEPAFPKLDYIVASQQLVELFQAQAAPEPELPPVLIPDYTAGEREPFTGAAAAEGPALHAGEVRRRRQLRIRRYQAPPPLPAPSRLPPRAAPPTPRLERSLMLRAELTVPRSGYTEPYTVWWDAASGASRVDMHAGATSAYRTFLPDGRVQAAEIRVDRSGEGEVRRCAVAAPRTPEPEDRAAPAFPDMEEFSFAGYSEAEFGRVERWTRIVSGRAGELGGARGEALVFRHELLVARAPDNYTSTPLRYSVAVDSSVLGADCDGYVHRYTELRDQHHEPALLRLDLAEACEEVEQDASRARVEPLREYTMLHRDPRYDDDFQRFKSEHRRQYLDDTEDAVRKTLMVQLSRFVDSGNRQGATFSMEVNHLSDRLDAELALLSGVREDVEGLPAEQFPHSRDQLAAMRGVLPRVFDWRQRGAVSHVRNQGSCSSCWAFAVTGAVEGALFVRTRRLVPLSEQCLVDCAQPFGGRGCGGTWPSAAYDYVQERGLPALPHYTPYQGKVLTCLDRRVPPVTHISSHVNVTRHSVPALKVAIRRHAPTVILIASSPKSFVSYKRGVLFDDRCPKSKPQHAVLGVGWGEQRGEPHFILKNSWSSAWGEGGYVRVHAASNTCGVLSRPSYPRLERTDVDEAAATAPGDSQQD